MKIATIVGARPQFVKASALSRAFRTLNQCEEILIHTGQHFDSNMSDIFFEEMEICKPKYNLGVGGNGHGAMTGRMLEGIESILLKEKPDWVLVYGDTNSTLAGALASVKLHLPVAHVEAGLRSFNRRMPEEINRILTDHCSELLFTPTEVSYSQLLKEGLPKHKLRKVGDVMYDSAIYYQTKSRLSSKILSTMNLQPKEYVLATVHRAENTDNLEKLEEIFQGLVEVSLKVPVVIPLHPRTKAVLNKNGRNYKNFLGLKIIEPVGYLDMIQLESNAQVILTDSGGVQKEAYFFGIPCITLREETEWKELIEHGFNQLVSIDRHSIAQAYIKSMERKMNWELKLYGDGTAAHQIAQSLLLQCNRSN